MKLFECCEHDLHGLSEGAMRLHNEKEHKGTPWIGDTHAPLPWVMQECDNVSLYEILSEKTGASIADCAYRFGDERNPEWKPQAKANAAFIVRAVNCHAELVENLKKVEHWFSQITTENSYRERLKLLESISKVIAKAEGNQ